MSSVVCALGFLTFNLNPRPTSECDCAFYQEVENDLFTWQVALLTTCMTTPDDSSCTINAVSDSLPLMVCFFPGSSTLHNSFQVTNMDSCMTSIEDSDCTSSYGATSNYVSNSGSSLVGWVQQLSMFQYQWLLWSFTTSPDQECPQSSNARWVLPLLRSATRRPRIQTGTKSQRIAAMSPSGMNRCGGY